MPGIRQAIEYLSKLAETPTDQRHPLVSRVLETDGLDVFTEYYGQLINLSRSGQAVMREIIDGALKRIKRDHGGIPFDFTARPVVAPPQPPRETVQVRAVSPERDACEIRFPRVQGYPVELPEERLSVTFDDNSTLELTPDVV